jgi:acetylornithine deacetylase/succinyl-diaminopimelate desuccinylase-like protein
VTIDITPADVEACVETLRDLIRIPSVNPPGGGSDVAAGRDPTGGETAAARHCADLLSNAGIAAEVLEPAPGRGSCFARLPATVADPEPPLILLSHLDVVPVDAESWSHDPFGAELIDGVIWGRGAVDMKDMLAMELGSLLALHRSGAERRRDVILAAVADEEAGGEFGALHWVQTRPELFRDTRGRPAAAALNEVGGYPIHLDGRRFATIQVAEKGIIWTRLRATGTPGHGSMPHTDNPTVKLARAITRLADAPKPVHLTPVVRSFLVTLGLTGLVEAADGGSEADVAAQLAAGVSDPVMRRSLDAMLRDTITPNVVHAGKKMNVIPGSGEGEVDVRTLPDTDQAAFLAHLQEVAGDEVEVSAVMTMPPVEAAAEGPIVDAIRGALHRADPESVPAPMMITPGTDAKALALLAIPTYGFAPLALEPDMPFLSLFHAHDERVPVSALAFGLPVLTDVVGRFVIAD